ncbi:OLC1v1039233C1 [Oldenlandia corymbosa var. corymbosa]|uniref:OLC1v1039233C1 n=1 Tax=Oldenlandia corymbosa var. corymbosa TaxID=529605 RepID=A0AAV1D1N5_OLDCO|nr:OLC1v1039233C1 [Oldenlandia corymbosa var. corymbosa]
MDVEEINSVSVPRPLSPSEFEFSEEIRVAREKHEKAVQDHIMKRRAAALAVPTNDSSVRARLRRLGEPVTLFGDREMERRERLRELMVKLDSEGQLEKLLKAHEDDEAAAGDDASAEEKIQYPFYTEGSNRLREARLDIARYSIVKAALCIHHAKTRRDGDPNQEDLVDAEVIEWRPLRTNFDERPLSGCSFSQEGDMLATCSLSGDSRIWSIPNMTRIAILRGGHTERATDVAFSPIGDLIATASADRTAKLWNTEGLILNTYHGHLDRLSRIAFHPMGKYLGTTSFDKTWRLWDVETGEELLLQEGHSRSVYGISFQGDGALVATCGLDALVRVWDLRSGGGILALEGHVKPVLGVSFSPNGYHLASGGEDNTCRVWDLRKKRSLCIIPAHSNLISQVKFESQQGSFLVTGSFDTTAKVWSSTDFRPIQTLSWHDAKVTSLDIARDGQYIATVSRDRAIKLWSDSQSDEEDMQFG